MLTGDNGIIKQAQTAKVNTEKSDIEEQINIMVVQSTERTGNVEKDVLLEKLNTLPKEKEIIDGDSKIYVIYPEYNFEIDIDSGDVTTIEDVEKVKDETPWELAGSGTESDPYLIESIEDLVAFSNDVNKGNSYNKKYIKLVNNLDFNLPFSYDNPKTKVSEKENRVIAADDSGTEIKNFLTTGTGFNPIGAQNKSFRGYFDGNGKEIRNIFINRPGEEYVSLFGQTGEELKNIGVTGIITGKAYVGGIAGNNYGKILYCYSKVNMTQSGSKDVGGITGNSNSSSSEIVSCYSASNIEGKSYLGGITSSCYKTKNCYNVGKIISLENGLGIAGVVSFGNAENCYNVGEINASNSSWVGGIASAGSIVNIRNSYNKGKIIGKSNIGGILGLKQQGAQINIEQSYYSKGTATGAVNGEDILGKAEAKEEAEMPSVLEVIQNQIEVDGQMINAFKEDTNNINNGYPILYWQ